MLASLQFSDDRADAATPSRLSGHSYVDDGIQCWDRDGFPLSTGCNRRSRCCPIDGGRDNRDRYSNRGAQRRSLLWPAVRPMRLQSEMFL